MKILRQSLDKITPTRWQRRQKPVLCKYLVVDSPFMRSSITFLFTLLLTSGLLAPSFSSGDPLGELEKSKLFRHNLPERKLAMSSLYNEKWFSRSTWYGRVFLEEDGTNHLFAWLGTDESKSRQRAYTGNASVVQKQREFLSVQREFVTPTFKKIQLTIVLPHPRSSVSCDSQLLTACANLIPSARERFKAEILEREPVQTEYIQTATNSCIFLTHLPRSVLMQVRADSCADAAELKEFFAELDIKTLVGRLAN